MSSEFGVTFKVGPQQISNKYLPAPPPELIPLDFEHENFTTKYSEKHEECLNSVPTIEDLLSTSELARKCGILNEIEYSANILFKKIRLQNKGPNIENRIRYYLNDTDAIYFTDSDVSSKFINGGNRDFVEICTRIDYFNEEDNTPEIVTTKLKVLKCKFNYQNTTYTLTGAIEIEFPELADAMKNLAQPENFTRRRQFTYWIINLKVSGSNYQFRVAFRKEDRSEDYLCNIECEDAICGADFIKCFDLLSKYYKHQYILQDGLITPMILDPKQHDAGIPCLTDEQKEIYKTMSVSRHTHEDMEIIPKDVAKFIKFKSLQTVNNFIDGIDLDLKTFSTFTVEMDYTADDQCSEVSNEDLFNY